MLISVVTGETATTLAGDICIKTDGKVTALNNRASFEPVYDAVAASMPPVVQTINGVSPNDKGEFFLSGSECASWDLADNDHTIQLVDLCPACTDCESLYRLKQEVIRMKLWLTLLRDVNLYKDGGSRNSVNFLWTRRIAKEALCGPYMLGDDFNDYWQEEGFTKSLQLIQQYMTMVHMWNYLVNRNNKSDVIQVAPEDTAGFSVQTKRSITSCHETQSIRCNIAITAGTVLFDDGTSADLNLVGAEQNYPVSVFIPRAVLEFAPYSKKQSAAGIPPVATVNNVTSNININPAASGEPVYCRSVDTGDIPSIAAGTYVVNAKFLPFVYSVMEDAEGNPISIRGTTATSISGTTTSGGTISFQFFATDTTPIPLAEPTAKQYLDAKTAPTCSVDFKILWTVMITWTVKEGNTEKTETQTYYYTCNGIRRYYSSSVIGGSTITPPETPSESTNA